MTIADYVVMMIVGSGVISTAVLVFYMLVQSRQQKRRLQQNYGQVAEALKASLQFKKKHGIHLPRLMYDIEGVPREIVVYVRGGEDATRTFTSFRTSWLDTKTTLALVPREVGGSLKRTLRSLFIDDIKDVWERLIGTQVDLADAGFRDSWIVLSNDAAFASRLLGPSVRRAFTDISDRFPTNSTT